LNKKLIREKILRIRNSLTNEEIKNYSDKIIDALIDSEFFKQSNNIMCYVSFNSEVYTHQFISKAIENGKNISVPYVDPINKIMLPCNINSIDELVIGHYGILSPDQKNLKSIDPKSIDLVIVPGAAFDREGYRVGYGGGYYDKFLPTLKKDAKKVGLAFSFQLIDKVPHEKYDIPVDFIITENSIIDCEVKND